MHNTFASLASGSTNRSSPAAYVYHLNRFPQSIQHVLNQKTQPGAALKASRLLRLEPAARDKAMCLGTSNRRSCFQQVHRVFQNSGMIRRFPSLSSAPPGMASPSFSETLHVRDDLKSSSNGYFRQPLRSPSALQVGMASRLDKTE